MKSVWTEPAEQERWKIIDYIANDNPLAALNLDEKISSAVRRLERFPFSGRTGRVDGTREVVIDSYILVYEIRNNRIEILQIIHGARQYP